MGVRVTLEVEIWIDTNDPRETIEIAESRLENVDDIENIEALTTEYQEEYHDKCIDDGRNLHCAGCNRQHLYCVVFAAHYNWCYWFTGRGYREICRVINA